MGKENLPSQTVSLWDEDYFRLIIFKRQMTQEDFLFTSPLNVYKNLDREVPPGTELLLPR